MELLNINGLKFIMNESIFKIETADFIKINSTVNSHLQINRATVFVNNMYNTKCIITWR